MRLFRFSSVLFFFLVAKVFIFPKPMGNLSDTSDTEIELRKSVLHALLYRDIFSYPLTAHGVFESLCRNSTNVSEVKTALHNLKDLGLIEEHGGYFGFGDIDAKVERRVKGNLLAEEMMPSAVKWSRFISGFPFVRAVFLSGSLSKNYMEADGDIDYFIVTAENRLWIARSLLVFFKKVFLLNSHKYFCVNYFVDDAHLEIEEQNLFTATEVVTLVPICGKEIFNRFSRANSWAKKYYPNFQKEHDLPFAQAKSGFFKNLVEKILSGALGEKADGFFMRMTISHWKKKFKNFDASRFDIALKSRKYVSKHHPNDYQKKVLDRFSENVKEINQALEQTT